MDTQTSRSLGIGEGWNWFTFAIQAVRNQMFRLFLIVFFYVFSMGFLSVLPLFGPVLAALFMPFGTVLLGYAVRDAKKGLVPQFSLMKKGWKEPYVRKNLIYLGLAFGLALVTLNALYHFMAEADLAQWKIDENNRVDWTSVAQNFPWKALFITIGLYIPVLMATWFSPLLAVEKKMSWGKSLFYSFFGCLKNLLPIIFLGILLTLSASCLTYISESIVTTFNLQGSEMFIYVPVFFLVVTTIYATYWPMYYSLFSSTRSDTTNPVY